MHVGDGARHARATRELPRTRTLMVDGVCWQVREVPSAGGGGRRPDLVFDSEEVVRRVRAYPDDWTALDDAALFALSFRR